MKRKKEHLYRNIILVIAIKAVIWGTVFFVPLIEPDSTIQCVSAPCKVPNWTIYEWYQNTYTENDFTIDTFDECVDATGTINNSFPRQCKYNGEIFVEP